MGLRIGTPDAEATITTRSARLDPGYSHVAGRRLSGRRPTHAGAGPCQPGLGDRPPLARSRLPLRAAVPHPRRDPVGGSAREAGGRCPVLALPAAGARPPAPRVPCGSSPVATAVSRAAARATTPSRNRRGPGPAARRARRRRPPAPGPRVPPVTRSASSARRADDLGVPAGDAQRRARRTRSAAASSAAGPVPAAGEVRQTPSRRPCSSATRTAPASTGPATVAVRPGRAAPRREPRTPAPRAGSPPPRVAGHPRRFTGWLCNSTSASRARSTAAATPGQRHDRSERICRQRHSARVSRQCEPARQDGAHPRLRALRSSS